MYNFNNFLNENTLSNLLWFIHTWADYKLKQGSLPCKDYKLNQLTGLEYDKDPYYNQGIRFIGIGNFQSQWNTNTLFQQAYGNLLLDGVIIENPNHRMHFSILIKFPYIDNWSAISWENEIKPTIKYIQEYYCIDKLEVPPEERTGYNNYIQYSDEWQLKRQQVLERDNYKCTECGSTEDLCVHHKTYKNLYHEPLEDLITLCDHCHKKAHGLL